jgi:hypothetical protein
VTTDPEEIFISILKISQRWQCAAVTARKRLEQSGVPIQKINRRVWRVSLKEVEALEKKWASEEKETPIITVRG